MPRRGKSRGGTGTDEPTVPPPPTPANSPASPIVPSTPANSPASPTVSSSTSPNSSIAKSSHNLSNFTNDLNNVKKDYNNSADVVPAHPLETTSAGGMPSKIRIGNKMYTLYVKMHGEFVTIKRAMAMAKKKK